MRATAFTAWAFATLFLGCSGGTTAGTTGGVSTTTTGGSTTGTTGATGGTTTGGSCFTEGYNCLGGGGNTVPNCCPGLLCNQSNQCVAPTGGTTSSGTSSGTSGGGTTGTSTGSTSSTSGGTSGPAGCPVAAASQCQTPGTAHAGSVVRGVAQLAAGFTPAAGTKGDLVMFLTHVYEGGGAQGGVFHAEDHVSNVDLSTGPVPFQIDMCHNDIAMYSEDDCAFNLIVMLDTNGNNSGTENYVPDVGEAANRQVISVSCFGDSQCLSVTLGCSDGLSCVAFTDPTDSCLCAAQTCNSDLRLCQ
jgi:hypothetical protein